MKIRNISANEDSEHVYEIDDPERVPQNTVMAIVSDWTHEPVDEDSAVARDWDVINGIYVTALSDEDGVNISFWEPVGEGIYSLRGAPFNFETLPTIATRDELFGALRGDSASVISAVIDALALAGSRDLWTEDTLIKVMDSFKPILKDKSVLLPSDESHAAIEFWRSMQR